MRRLTHILVLVGFIFSCGGQWAVLQCVAWVNMIHDYSATVPLAKAVNMTFSGKYPCAMCKVIAEKKQPQNSKLLAFEKYDKNSFPPACRVALVYPTVSLIPYPDYLDSLRFHTEGPPTPPPRSALS